MARPGGYVRVFADEGQLSLPAFDAADFGRPLPPGTIEQSNLGAWLESQYPTQIVSLLACERDAGAGLRRLVAGEIRQAEPVLH